MTSDLNHLACDCEEHHGQYSNLHKDGAELLWDGNPGVHGCLKSFAGV